MHSARSKSWGTVTSSVAFGDHPSGAPYTWAPQAPGDFSLSDVPAVTLDQIHSFLDKSAVILGADDVFADALSGTTSSPLGLQASIEVVEWSTVGPANRRSGRLELVEQDWHGHLERLTATIVVIKPAVEGLPDGTFGEISARSGGSRRAIARGIGGSRDF